MHRFGILFQVAMAAIGRNKMRSALTALGIIIGVACVLTMIGVGQGSAGAIASQISSPRFELPARHAGRRDTVGRHASSPGSRR